MDLTTNYMGLELKNPIVASASPQTGKLDTMRKLEEAGVSAIVMCSLFEEQIKHEAAAIDYFMQHGTEQFGEALSYFPQIEEYNMGPERHLEILHKASEDLEIPVIASLNGVTNEGWTEYAKRMEEAGAAGIELNVYYIPADIDETSQEVENRYIEVLQAVKAAVEVPVALKLSPFFSSMAHLARLFDEAGADALVLFNRFYQPDFDLKELKVIPSLNLSDSYEIRLPLMWIAILYGRVKASIAATRGVQCAEDIVKYIMAGADVVMTTSALLKNGTNYAGHLVEEFEKWLEQHEYESVAQMKGSMSQQHVTNPSNFTRANYIKILEAYKSQFAS